MSKRGSLGLHQSTSRFVHFRTADEWGGQEGAGVGSMLMTRCSWSEVDPKRPDSVRVGMGVSYRRD